MCSGTGRKKRKMRDERTDEERLEDRKKERELHARGLVRVSAYLANLAIKCDIPIVRGPKIQSQTVRDPGIYVPVWLEWHLQRFPQNEIQQSKRLEIVKALSENHRARHMLLIEAQMLGGTLYDPMGDVATEAALRLMREEYGDELSDE